MNMPMGRYIEVTKCRECIYSELWNMVPEYYQCEHGSIIKDGPAKKIDDPSEIPLWCPLLNIEQIIRKLNDVEGKA